MRTLYLDVDTQLDFLLPAGALYVPQAERLIPRIATLNRNAITQGHLLLATRDAHFPDDPEFQFWPHHCVAGTLGQRKPAETIVNGIQYLDKLTVNCFDQPAMAAFLAQHQVTHAVVYGVVTEICVAHAVRGLLDRHIQVTIETSAVQHLNTANRDLFLAEASARGAILA
jgi:nicotinamidase/pyrazinamidase